MRKWIIALFLIASTSYGSNITNEVEAFGNNYLAPVSAFGDYWLYDRPGGAPVGPPWDVTASQMGHWKCNDAAANTTLVDDSGQSNNGTLTGGDNTQDVSQDPGKIVKSLLLNGIDDSLNLSTVVGDISGSSTGSVSFWLKPTDVTQTTDALFQFGDASAVEFIRLVTDLTAGKLRARMYRSAAQSWDFTTDNVIATNNVWMYLVMNHEGTEPSLYFNGSLTAITFNTTTAKTHWWPKLAGFDSARFGCREQSGVESIFLGGQYDDIRILDRPLSTNEITRIYNDGNGTEADSN